MSDQQEQKLPHMTTLLASAVNYLHGKVKASEHDPDTHGYYRHSAIAVVMECFDELWKKHLETPAVESEQSNLREVRFEDAIRTDSFAIAKIGGGRKKQFDPLAYYVQQFDLVDHDKKPFPSEGSPAYHSMIYNSNNYNSVAQAGIQKAERAYFVYSDGTLQCIKMPPPQ
jgi:hypothetical protein